MKEEEVILFGVDSKTAELKQLIESALPFTLFSEKLVEFVTDRCVKCYFGEMSKAV